jgi:hypothetical protein
MVSLTLLPIPSYGDDEYGFTESAAEELANRFCPSLVLHSEDHEVSPEPVEMVTSRVYERWEHFSPNPYNMGEFISPWTLGTGPWNYSWMDFDDQQVWSGWNFIYGGLTCGDAPANEPYVPFPHFEYAGFSTCDALGGYNDGPDGWYAAYLEKDAATSGSPRSSRLPRAPSNSGRGRFAGRNESETAMLRSRARLRAGP